MGCNITGPKFTQYNNWRPVKRIWKRLDRVFVNDKWAQIFQKNFVKHLPRTGSDHRPLMLQCYDNVYSGIKYFWFLDFWTDQPKFMQLVEETWNTNITGNPIWILQQKLKLLSRKLSQWSRDGIGNVFDQVHYWENKMHNLEELDLLDNNDQSREDLNKGQVEYIRWIGIHEALLKQKSQIN